MTSDITIPPEALEAAAKTAWEIKYMGLSWVLDCPEHRKQSWRKSTRAACIAMLRNWPGMQLQTDRATFQSGKLVATHPDLIILPLPEKPDAKG